jgi:hypothetical protein
VRRITEVFVFVADNFGPAGTPLDGEEGIVAEMVELPGCTVYSPYITAKSNHVDAYRAAAQHVANAIGKPLRILRLSGPVVIDTIEPLPQPTNPPPEGVQ